jgi:hypothetical protein
VVCVEHSLYKRGAWNHEVIAAIELFRYQIQDKIKTWQELPM